MSDLESLKAKIRAAFDGVQFPGDWCLIASWEGDEPYRLESEFKGKDDWRTLDASFLDQAPDGLASALSFFSDEAFHFYLPAYLLADLDGQLRRVDLVYHLTHGLDDTSRDEKINPRRYGERTWFDHARHKFSMLNREESAAIGSYLMYKRNTDELTDLDKSSIDEALKNFWTRQAA